MQLTDSFTLPVSVDRLWEVLTDVELIAPCVPGFKLEEAADPEYRGAMNIKVGAITVAYQATITFVDRDDESRRAVLAVAGRERRGGGRVNAAVTASLSGEGEQATAEMVTDVEVTGRVAQFGRGIIADVSSHLTRQFVDNLTTQVLAKPEVSDDAERTEEVSKERRAPAPPSIDLGATAAGFVLKRVAAGLAVALLVAVLLKRRAG